MNNETRNTNIETRKNIKVELGLDFRYQISEFRIQISIQHPTLNTQPYKYRVMKKLLLLTALLVIQASVFAQSCLPEGITFETQAQIDSFQINYPGCTEIEGDVQIQGNDIVNLNALSVITSIEGTLSIGRQEISGNSSLINLAGLEGLTTIGGSLRIANNDALTSLTGLDNLTSIGGTLYIGLDVQFNGNPALISLTGLESLTSIGNSVWIWDNSSLTSLSALKGITSLENMWIRGNTTLTNLEGLENLTSIHGGLGITSNTSLTSLSALEGLVTLNTLLIYSNDSLTNLTGLEGLTSIGYLEILDNHSLTSLTGLDNLSYIEFGLVIGNEPIGNPALSSLTALEGLSFVGGKLWIIDNHSLTSLSGLENIDADSIANVCISNNPNLSICHFKSICDYLNIPNGEISIHDNAPGCTNPEEVQDSCEAHAGYNEIWLGDFGINLFPNPASQKFNISAEGFTIEEIALYTLTGQQVYAIRSKPKSIDISNLPEGMYIVEVTLEGRKIRQKLLVHRH
jgi:hypothetical protein